MAKSASAYSRLVETEPQTRSGKKVCVMPSVFSSCGT